MQVLAYQDVAHASPGIGREQEGMAFDRAIALLEEARAHPDEFKRRHEAIRTIQVLWQYLIRDLTDPANDLSDDLRANLISIGLWCMKESDAILSGASENWAGLIDINRTIREGLS